jgi:membrane-bound ClpP family serine protease
MVFFVTIALASFILVAGSFFLHFDHDGGFDHDVDHSMDHGGGDGADEHTISLFSTKVLGMLTMGFGAGGAIAKYYIPSYLVPSLIGVGCGGVLAAGMYGLLTLIVRQQSTSLIPTDTLVGASGTVVVAIFPEAVGEVGVSFAGQYSVYSAKSHDGKEIAKGRTVRVVQTLGSQLVVQEIHV